MDDMDLIDRLLTYAGTIMEDTAAMVIIDPGAAGVPDRLLAVQSAGHDLLALASAVEVVQRRGGATEF